MSVKVLTHPESESFHCHKHNKIKNNSSRISQNSAATKTANTDSKGHGRRNCCLQLQHFEKPTVDLPTCWDEELSPG